MYTVLLYTGVHITVSEPIHRFGQPVTFTAHIIPDRNIGVDYAWSFSDDVNQLYEECNAHWRNTTCAFIVANTYVIAHVGLYLANF